LTSSLGARTESTIQSSAPTGQFNSHLYLLVRKLQKILNYCY